MTTNEIEHCTTWDIFELKEGEDLPDGAEEDIDKYLYRFAKPPEHGLFHCCNCGKKLLGTMVDQLIGNATFQWGIAHGHGYCSHCQWPAVMYHFPKESEYIERFEACLSVHPEFVSKRNDD